MTELTTILLLLAAPAALLAFLLFRRYRKRKARLLNDIPAMSPLRPEAWEIGPIIDGRSKSINVPVHPRQGPRGLEIDIPHPSHENGHVHYVTFNPGSLVGKNRIVMRYSMEMAEGTRIRPASPPGDQGPSILTLFLQRRGDDWSAAGDKETYRWWASARSVMPIEAGDHEIVAYLDEKWTSTMISDSRTSPLAFQDALDNVARVGFTLGGGDGLGHGVHADGPCKFIIRSFVIS